MRGRCLSGLLISLMLLVTVAQAGVIRPAESDSVFSNYEQRAIAPVVIMPRQHLAMGFRVPDTGYTLTGLTLSLSDNGGTACFTANLHAGIRGKPGDVIASFGTVRVRSGGVNAPADIAFTERIAVERGDYFLVVRDAPGCGDVNGFWHTTRPHTDPAGMFDFTAAWYSSDGGLFWKPVYDLRPALKLMAQTVR